MNSKNSPPPVRLAVFTQKGGVGKTTTSHSLACGLARSGARVLILDLDAQGCLSQWFGAGEPTLYDVITGETSLPATVQASGVPGLDILPADESLAGAEGLLRAQRGGELWLRRQLRTLPSGRWDWILMDCPPGLGILTVAALTAADFAVSPVVPNAMDAGGMARVLGHVAEIRETELNPRLELLGVAAVMVDRRRTLTRDVLSELGEALDGRLFETTVPVDVRIAEAPSHRLSIYDYAPASRAAAAYAALTEEIRHAVEKARTRQS